MKNTLYEISLGYADKQSVIVDPFFRETPLFNSMPCMEASKGPYNIFEKVKNVDVMQIVDYDAPLPVLTTSSELGYATIGKVGGKIQLAKDHCALEGKEKILAKKLPLIMNRTGQAFDYTYTYNSLKKFCLDNKSNCVTRINTSGSGNNYYSMIGITWSEGENCGLFQPALSGQKMFNIDALYGGALGAIRDENGREVSGYTYEITTFLGIQIAREDRIHALVNIDAEHVPTYKQLLDFVYAFGGYTNQSFIYCHPLCLNMIIAAFSTDEHYAKFIRINDDGTVSVGSCRIIPNKNMLAGTEAYVEP